jgi:hypothetical protein
MKKHRTYHIHKNKSMTRRGKRRTVKNEDKFVYIRKTCHTRGKYNLVSRKLRGGGGALSKLAPNPYEEEMKNTEFLKKIRKEIEEQKAEGKWEKKTELDSLPLDVIEKKLLALSEIREELERELEEQLKSGDKRSKSRDTSGSKKSKSKKSE